MIDNTVKIKFTNPIANYITSSYFEVWNNNTNYDMYHYSLLTINGESWNADRTEVTFSFSNLLVLDKYIVVKNHNSTIKDIYGNTMLDTNGNKAIGLYPALGWSQNKNQ